MVGGEEGWVKLIGDGSGWGWVLRVRGRLRGGGSSVTQKNCSAL